MPRIKNEKKKSYRSTYLNLLSYFGKMSVGLFDDQVRLRNYQTHVGDFTQRTSLCRFFFLKNSKCVHFYTIFKFQNDRLSCSRNNDIFLNSYLGKGLVRVFWKTLHVTFKEISDVIILVIFYTIFI